jgi:hypothetical protein
MKNNPILLGLFGGFGVKEKSAPIYTGAPTWSM